MRLRVATLRTRLVTARQVDDDTRYATLYVMLRYAMIILTLLRALIRQAEAARAVAVRACAYAAIIEMPPVATPSRRHAEGHWYYA